MKTESHTVKKILDWCIGNYENEPIENGFRFLRFISVLIILGIIISYL